MSRCQSNRLSRRRELVKTRGDHVLDGVVTWVGLHPQLLNAAYRAVQTCTEFEIVPM